MNEFKSIQDKWQKRWSDTKAYEVQEDPAKKKCYVLEMYPYPSGSGLHMGHARNYVIGDVYARYKRMNGYNVLYPMGYDSFGLPAENAAIKAKSHPKIFTEQAIANFIRQQKGLGLSYDWTRMVETHKPDYYKWDQWIFLKMYEKGLAYKKKASVNWCGKCNTVLANEQVHDGMCWRHLDTAVELKHLEQWFFRITKYAEELYDGIDKLEDWADDVKAMQRNWIGKSEGTEIQFSINGHAWNVFTTRPDTLYGVTFLVVAAQHSKLHELVTPEQQAEVDSFLKRIKSTSEKDLESLDKDGVFTGSYAVHPITGDKIPVYAGNFVVADYGAGMVMAVPAHDQRDFEFAKKYQLPIKIVINPDDAPLNAERMARAYTGEGILVNSAEFNGSRNTDAILEITEHLKRIGKGKRVVQYKLRDWLISRQRFWGTPIPIIYCEHCGAIAVPEKDLPVALPEDIVFESERNPLVGHAPFVNAACPTCGKPARRETDTMDTFVNSSWYFFRYCDAKNEKAIFDPAKAKHWMPIDLYIGGKEHACMHLIYFRFYTKFFRDLGLTPLSEPTQRLFNQGMLHGQDGAVMSKSRGNVVLPEEISDQYGIDAARYFLMFVASPDKDVDWSDTGIQSAARMMSKVFALLEKPHVPKGNSLLESKMHRAIKNVTEKIEALRYNQALIDLNSYIRFLDDQEAVTKESIRVLACLISPFCPHIASEMGERLGDTKMSWPAFDESKIDAEAEYAEEVVARLKEDIITVLRLAKIERPKRITLIVADSWKYHLVAFLKRELELTRNGGELIKKAMADEHLKKHGQEVTKIVPSAVKDPTKLPLVLKTQQEEQRIFEHGKQIIEKEFGCLVHIELADASMNPKAKNAMPGKPAIVVE